MRTTVTVYFIQDTFNNPKEAHAFKKGLEFNPAIELIGDVMQIIASHTIAGRGGKEGIVLSQRLEVVTFVLPEEQSTANEREYYRYIAGKLNPCDKLQ